MARRLFVAGLAAAVACGGQQQSAAISGSTALTAASAVAGAPAFGDPLPGLTAADSARFEAGRIHFQTTETPADGLGPVFNEASCAACHTGPAVGGSTGRLETRFGRVAPDGTFDPLASEGGSLLQDHGIGSVPGFFYGPETVPADANVVAQRRTTPLFGLGLVDATPDEEIRSLADLQARAFPEQAGTVAVVANLVTGRSAVGKFGWKDGNPTLFQFSADAYLNEMGVTSPLFPNENCPNGRCADLAWNPLPSVNDPTGADVTAFNDFMTLLAPPPRGPRTPASDAGERLFAAIGCAVCHVPSLVTGANAVSALDRVEFHPYSDFLLHDMGALGDGIVQGAANARQMRTQPLWGLRAETTLLHDGRAATPADAILAHDGQGRAARERFAALKPADRDALLAFLDTL